MPVWQLAKLIDSDKAREWEWEWAEDADNDVVAAAAADVDDDAANLVIAASDEIVKQTDS